MVTANSASTSSTTTNTTAVSGNSPDPGPTIFVLFGATGDLAKRMVLPAFYRLWLEHLLPEQWLLVG
ncbi:MAG TPA: glucose-6-phosphate dehydrogenase, partial [Streptosporangiaceae bacterium]|nr:glucose-6-phosphate dehydrogenase [Streptosporangiaceae bacterium]